MADLTGLTREQLIERRDLLQRKQALESQQGGQQLGTQATEEQFLPTSERLKGGFRRPEDLTQVREQQRAERGLAPGTPLEPTGFNLRNLMDLPADIADAIGPAFPVIGATAGGLAAGLAASATGPGAVVAGLKGGAAGGALGELAQQRVGAMLGFDQGTIIQQLGDIAKEGAFGATQEVGGVFLGRALNSTKRGILRAANGLLKRRGGEGFVKGFGSIATHLDKAQTQFALDAVKAGDNRVLRKLFANREFADTFAERLFLGHGKNKGIAKQISRLSHRPGAKEPIRDLYKQFFPEITDDVFETIFKKGPGITKFNKPNTLLELGENINKGLDDLFTKSGKELGKARLDLAKKAGNVDVGELLSTINASLADDLHNVGFLVKEGDGLFSINPSFAGTRTGTAQAKTFGQLVSRFFESGDDALIKAAEGGSVEALQKLANRKTVFNVRNTAKFKDFIGKLKTIDVQISGSEFKALGKLSPQLVDYLDGLRSIPLAAEQQIGGSQVATLTKTFREFAEGAQLLRQGKKVKSPQMIEKALQRLSNAEPGTAAAKTSGELNNFLQKNLKVNFLDDLRSFKAAQAVKQLEGTFGTTKGRAALTSAMKNAFDPNAAPLFRDIERLIDPVLPKGLRIAEHARIHTVAGNLHRNAASLLRGRFLYNALIGGTVGSALGPVGATAGIGVGLALQNPGILRALIKGSAKLSNAQVQQMIARGASAATQRAVQQLPAGGRLLQSLLQQR